MKFFVRFFIILFFSVLIFSCETTEEIREEPEVEKTFSYHNATYLNELLGKWESQNGVYEYPFVVNGKRYMRYAWNASDDTSLWISYAEKKSIELSELWQKRYVYAAYIYNQNLPVSDKNGTEMGIKLFKKNNRIYSRKEILISENVLLVNLNYFFMRDDGKSFIEKGSFNLASDKFSPLTSDSSEYVKTGDLHL